MSMRWSWTKKPGLTQRNTSVRPPPGGNPSGGGVGAGSSNPFGNVLPAGPAGPNAKPAAPPTIVQQGGQPSTVPAKKITSKPKARSGDEYRRPTAVAEPVPVAEPTPPHMSKLSPSDRVNTITHLADTTTKAAKHVVAHANQAVQGASQMKDPKSAAKNAPSVQHNAQHTAAHALEVMDHATKLGKAVAKYPGAKAAAAELNQPAPSKKPQPPKRGK